MAGLILSAALVGFGAVLLWPKVAFAHCDTLDGPAVQDGRKALESGNLNFALKWIPSEAEAELRQVFQLCREVRGLSPEARDVADRLFLETLVRLHRAAEGVGFDGLKPSGTELPAAVVAADQAIAVGDISPLAGLLEGDRLAEAERLLAAALALKDFEVDDVEAGRDYVAAYVSFFKYAEAEDHGHAEHGHAEAQRGRAGHHH